MVVNRIGDFGLALGIFGIFICFDSVDYATVFSFPPSERELALSPSKMWRPASPAHERRRTTTRHVRRQTPVPCPWPTRSIPSPWQPPPTPRDDRYLDLRLSKLMFVNKFFPADTRKPIKELASQVDAAFRSLGIDKCHLRLAVQLANQDGTALCGFLVDDILRLRDLLDRAYATPAGAGWIREAAPLQFPPTADRTAATQLLIRSMRDTLSGIFDVADPTGTVTMDSPVWVSGWNAPLLKLTKAAINANRDDTHDLHRLVDDLFSQIKERLSSGSGGPASFKILLTDFADYFDRAPRGAALETLQKFGVRTGTPFSSYLRALRVVVASTVEKGGPLAPSATMAIELVRIRTAQQYPTLMPTLFPGDRATREKPYASLALMWTAFVDLKHNTSPAINGDAFGSAPQVSSSHAPPTINVSTAFVTAPHRHNSRPSRPSHTVSNVSLVHSRRDPFRIDYGIWPFDDQDYAIVCTVTNHALHTKLSLWTLLLTEDARRQACVQNSGRCCNCGSSDHSLRWCPSPFANVFSRVSNMEPSASCVTNSGLRRENTLAKGEGHHRRL